MVDARERIRVPWRAVSAGLAALLVLIAACFDLEWTARAWDAQEELQWARRIVSLGGPLYATTADQKGPLWQLCYVLAYAIGGSLNAWFVVAGMIIVVALTTSLAVWLIALRAGPSRVVAGGAASAVVLILVLGPEEFSHELYSRNLTGLLLVAALAAIVTLPHVRGRRRTLLMVGAAMAVGRQTTRVCSACPGASGRLQASPPPLSRRRSSGTGSAGACPTSGPSGSPTTGTTARRRAAPTSNRSRRPLRI